jgi:hypothetical protein
MPRFRLLLTVAAAIAVLAAWQLASTNASSAPADIKEAILKPADIQAKLFPERVFFRGQVATVQFRNTAGVHFSDDTYFLAGIVDSSGYSSELRQKYQAYVLNEVTLEIGGHKLAPGAYGVGFIAGNKFVVMDLGAHDLFQVPSFHDAEMKRPVPLQVTSAPGGGYRFYCGREYVEFHRAS